MTGKTISHYTILEKLGEGGMGVVYKAEDLKLDRAVAIKFLTPNLSSSQESKARFMQEAKATAALNHPNILNVFEIDEQDGGMFFVMEYIEGKTLKSYITGLKSGNGIPVRQAIEWTIQIAHGLRSAHEKGIVHRDIKPENLMLTKDSNLKIMDFGIAKLKGGTGLTRTGASLGTLSYMSPEQTQGMPADHRSDIWSLGVVFYEMLTTELPFKAEHAAGLSYVIINEDPPPPSALDRRIPLTIDTIVKKMLEKEPAKRYQDITEVLKSLEAARADLDNTVAALKTKAIAVLPFNNMSNDPENEYFSDGLTEELIINLSRLKDIRVVSRTTSMQYKGTKKDIKTIGRELGTRYMLEGSVRKFQDNIRITAQLIDVESDAQLWAEAFKGTLADVFDFQEKTSKQIVDALMVKLTPVEAVSLTKRSTINAEAFDCNLRARNFLYRRTKNNLQFAIHLFQQAIELDPRYAAAYAGLGEAYATLFQDFDRKDHLLKMAIESSLKALMYDASLSEAYTSLGLAYLNSKSLDEAVEASKKAIELDPNNYTGHWILGRIYHMTDRDKEAIKMFKKALALNPDFFSAGSDLYLSYIRLGETENADEQLKYNLQLYPKYLAIYPDDARGHMFYAIDLAQIGKMEEAKAEAAKALELNPGDPLMLYNSACFYAQLNEKNLALDSLRNAFLAGYQNFEWLKRDSDLDCLREEPVYIELMKGK